MNQRCSPIRHFLRCLVGRQRRRPAFADDNPEALRDLLRALGLSDELVRAIVHISIWKKYEARYADSIRQQDNDWRLHEAATRRLTLPADTPARLYTLRDSAGSAAQ